MAKSSRVPPAVGAIPVVGDLVKQAEGQAQWAQDVLEQNARLIGQLPATLASLNDTLERLNQTVARLDGAVSAAERAAERMLSPMEQLTTRLERVVALLAELPGAGLLRRFTAPPDPPS